MRLWPYGRVGFGGCDAEEREDGDEEGCEMHFGRVIGGVEYYRGFDQVEQNTVFAQCNCGF